MSVATLLLSGPDLQALMKPADYFQAVERGFIAAGNGRASSPHPLQLTVPLGVFHGKAALLSGERSYFALKLNGNLPGNPERTGLPTIQGALLLCDATGGALLAVMDSIEITLRRTAAATALAARYLARSDASVLMVCGCGQQAVPHVEALREVLPIRQILAWDKDAARAAAFAREVGAMPDVSAKAVTRLEEGSLVSDVIVTCTTSKTAFLRPEHVRPGTFIAAVGADSPSKSEITPDLMERATVVVDVLDQCIAMGDLRLALATSALSSIDVHASLSDLLTRARTGRTSAEEITLFDSTGTAIEDVASAAVAYERAFAGGRCTQFCFASEPARATQQAV
jgi:ornithine cyclodeaminase/alanine dehydrogenase-like protein (mu-crystallin family)